MALNVAPETGPFGAPISSAPVILPVGLAPSAANIFQKRVAADGTSKFDGFAKNYRVRSCPT